jgi:hypothetical protein
MRASAAPVGDVKCASCGAFRPAAHTYCSFCGAKLGAGDAASRVRRLRWLRWTGLPLLSARLSAWRRRPHDLETRTWVDRVARAYLSLSLVAVTLWLASAGGDLSAVRAVAPGVQAQVSTWLDEQRAHVAQGLTRLAEVVGTPAAKG